MMKRLQDIKLLLRLLSNTSKQEDEMRTPELLVMRLVDMGRIHPGQDNSHKCSRCGYQVGIYPSGQDFLRKNDTARIVCTICADVSSKSIIFEAPSDQIIQEMRESLPKKDDQK
jgi:hypothetical protein